MKKEYKKKNKELRELFQESDLVSFIKKKQIRWMGYVVRRPDQRIPQKTSLRVNRKGGVEESVQNKVG